MEYNDNFSILNSNIISHSQINQDVWVLEKTLVWFMYRCPKSI